MWRYIKYFVPIFLTILAWIFLILYKSTPSNNYEDSDQLYLLTFTSTLAFGAIWYLLTSKPYHRFSKLISLGIFVFVIPILIVGIINDESNSVAKFLLTPEISTGYFVLVLILTGIFYCLRFYSKPVQNIYSILKLLIILVSVVIAIIFILDIINDLEKQDFLAVAAISFIILLNIIHIIDMIRWERNKQKQAKSNDALDGLIDQISGNS